jgi:hypothetical protein
MPDANGKYQLQDFQAELQARGFDGYSPSDQVELINRGYLRIARQTRWLWEQGTMAFNLIAGGAGAGAAYYDLSQVPTFGSLKKLYITTANLQAKLSVIDSDRFFQYLAGDPTNPGNQGVPTGYRIFDNRLYVFPTPNQALSFLAYITQKMVKLVNPTDVPLTPAEYDDAVMASTLIYAHERSHEWDEANQYKEELAEVFDNAMEDEVFEDEEEQERAVPDDTWL